MTRVLLLEAVDSLLPTSSAFSSAAGKSSKPHGRSKVLTQRSHSVVTTVRSEEKADQIKKANPGLSKNEFEFAIVKGIAVEGAFDEAVQSNPPFEAVIHTASCQPHWPADHLLDPAVIDTTGTLNSIQKNAPDVTRVVITSSFAAIMDPFKGNWPEQTYSETNWNPMTQEQALKTPGNGYTASKLFAEQAAWSFVEKEKPNFTLATLAPPFVFHKELATTKRAPRSESHTIFLGHWKDVKLKVAVSSAPSALVYTELSESVVAGV